MTKAIDAAFWCREAVPLLQPFANRGIEGYVYNRSVEGRRDMGGVWNE